MKFSQQHPLSIQEQHPDSFHIVLLFQKNKRKKNEIDQDIVVGSITIVIESNFVLILWMGINQKLFLQRIWK